MAIGADSSPYEISSHWIHLCLDRMQQLGYNNGKQLSWVTVPNDRVNARAHPGRPDCISHQIGIYDGLIAKLYKATREFSETRPMPDVVSVSMRQIVYTLFAKEVWRDTHLWLFRFALTFTVFHEVGHLNQQHWLYRRSLAPQGKDETPDEDAHLEYVDKNVEMTGEEALLQQTLERCADHEGITRTMDMIRAMSSTPDGKPQDVQATTQMVWLAMVGICIFCYLLHEQHGSRQLYPLKGSHPRPSARMLEIITDTYEYILRHPDFFPLSKDADACLDFLEEAIITASQFWYARSSSQEMPTVHAEMQDPSDFFAWRSCIRAKWIGIAPALNKQRICPGAKLPES